MYIYIYNDMEILVVEFMGTPWLMGPPFPKTPPIVFHSSHGKSSNSMGGFAGASIFWLSWLKKASNISLEFMV